jgi:integrase/recombinase XerD
VIKVADVDFAQGTVTIIHLKRRLKLSCSICGTSLASAHLFFPKCGGKIEKSHAMEQQNRRQRVLPIDHDTMKMLQEYIDRDVPVTKEGKKIIFGINRHRAWQIVEILSRPNGLKSLLTGKFVKMKKQQLYGKQEQRLEAALHLVVFLEKTGIPLELIRREINQLIQRAVKYTNTVKARVKVR